MKMTMKPEFLIPLALLVALVMTPNAALAESELSMKKLSAPVQYASHHDEDEDDEDYDELEELEIESLYLEVEQARLQTIYGTLELMQEAAEIAADDDAVLAMAVLSIKDSMEPKEAITILEEVVQKSKRKVARRLARLQLAELYGEMDNPSEAKIQLRAILFEED